LSLLLERDDTAFGLTPRPPPPLHAQRSLWCAISLQRPMPTRVAIHRWLTLPPFPRPALTCSSLCARSLPLHCLLSSFRLSSTVAVVTTASTRTTTPTTSGENRKRSSFWRWPANGVHRFLFGSVGGVPAWSSVEGSVARSAPVLRFCHASPPFAALIGSCCDIGGTSFMRRKPSVVCSRPKQ